MRNGWPILITLFAVGSLVLIGPSLISAMPDRYVAQLPEPLQRYGLPQITEPILPTVAAPVAAAALLSKPTVSPTVMSERSLVPTVAATASTTTTASSPGTKAISKPEPDVTATTSAPSQTLTVMPTASPTSSATATASPVPVAEAVRLDGFQHQFQTWNNCGPATMAMLLSFFGEKVSQDDTARFMKPDPEDRNVRPDEMANYVNQETSYRAQDRANGSLEKVKRLLGADIPVIVEIGIDPPGDLAWLGWYGHYLLVVAYDDSLQQVWVYDSWLGTGETPLENVDRDGRIISYDDLMSMWEQFNYHYIAVYRPEQASTVAGIVGPEMNDDVMWQNALDRAKLAVEEHPQNAFAWFNLGSSYTALNQFEEGAVAFDQARSIGLPWRMLWYQFGPYKAYLRTDRFDDVLTLADTTLEGRPYFEESYYYRGLALEATGQLELARRDLESAARFNPRFEPAILALESIN